MHLEQDGVPDDVTGLGVPPADPPTPDRASILVVDDRRANLVAMEALLAPLGRRVVLAESGEEALRILLHERFALILLDVQMPGMDGFETARLIRGRLRTRRIPIIFVTAISTASSHVYDGYAAGAVDYLLKPVDPVVLRSKVNLFVELFEVNARLQRQATQRGMEESLALAQQAGLSGVWDWHLPSDRVVWSQEYAELVGLADDVPDDPRAWLSTVHPGDRARVQASLRTVIDRGGTWDERYRVVHPVRGQRWLSARGRVFTDQDGQADRFVGIATDVTERQRAEDELRRLYSAAQRLAFALTGDDVAREIVREAGRLPGVAAARLEHPGEAGAADLPAPTGREVELPLDQDGVVLRLVLEGPGAPDQGFLTAFAAQCAQALARGRLHDAERTARRSTEALQAATESLAEFADEREAATAVVREAMRTFGAVAASVRLLRDGSLVTVAAGGYPDSLSRPSGASGLDDAGPTVAAVRDGAVFHEGQGEAAGPAGSPGAWPGLEALAALPLEFDGRTIGSLGLRFDDTRPFAHSDRRTLAAFARIAAMSVLRARANARDARRRAHSELLAAVAEALESGRDVRARLEALAARFVPAWADGCRVELPGTHGGPPEIAVEAADPGLRETLAALRPSTPPRRRGVTIGAAEGAGGPFAALVGAGALGDREARQLAGRAALAIAAPLPAGAAGIGRIVLVARDDARQLAELPIEEIAERAGTALENARLYEAERDVATTLQQSLLPDLPVLRDLTLAARYVAATAHTQAGGDWYEAVEISPDRVVLAVGDVVGRGTTAASVMGQLRSAMRAYALAGLSPAKALAELSRFAAGVPGASVSTAACVRVDLREGRLVYACAGHPPPLVMGPDGVVTTLGDGRGPALGVAARPYVEDEAPFPVGACLLLYTDGLVERRDQPLDTGLARLAAAARELRAEPPGRMADRLVAALTGSASADDVALLVARRDPVPAPLELRLPARPASLGTARGALRDWLGAAGAEAGESHDVILAAGEALSNAVEHAYAGGRGDVRLEARLEPGRAVALTIADEGGWRPPTAGDGSRGRGLPIMRSVMDRVAVDGRDGGTSVRMSRRLLPRDSGPAPAPPPGGAVPPPRAGTVVVRGDLDAAVVAPLRTRILAGAPAHEALALDMCGVTYIDSAGARLVAELAGRHAAEGLTVLAPEDGPVRRLLEVTGLDALVAFEAPDTGSA